MYSTIPCVQTIILSCIKLGITDVVISPGSRNAPLTIGFASNKEFNCYSIVDERSAGFFALGIAQQTKKPVILLCTSGSALLNYSASVAEAFFSEIPLIILSADRPKYKINIGDGQTINQLNVFGKNILSSDELIQDVTHQTQTILSSNKQKLLPPNLDSKALEKLQLKTQSLNEELLNSRINASILLQKPVHINVPFEEPLYNFIKTPTVSLQNKVKKKTEKLPKLNLDEYNNIISQNSKILVLVGTSKPGCFSKEVINKIKDNSSIVVLTESTSNLHDNSFFGNIDQLIAPIELLKTRDDQFENLKPELLITTGGMIISKKIKDFLRKHSPSLHLHVGENEAKDTYFKGVKHLDISPNLFFNNLLPKKHISSKFNDSWKRISEERVSAHNKFIKLANFSDFIVFSIICSQIPAQYQIQAANSSPIRYLQLFNLSNSNDTYCNRGTSGIDGSTSTAVGAALVSDSPVLLITGDLSFFYDINGLWNNYIKSDFRIILINNSGGGIFRILPGHENNEIFSKFIETKHDLKAKKIAQLYGFDYQNKTTKWGVKLALKTFFKKSKKPKILEITTPSELSSKTLKNYFEFLSKN